MLAKSVTEALMWIVQCTIYSRGVNVQIDHMYRVVRTPPTVSVSELMGVLKGRTAIRLFTKFLYLRKKKLWSNHFWQREYFVDSVGANEEIIRRYARQQHQVVTEEKQRPLLLGIES